MNNQISNAQRKRLQRLNETEDERSRRLKKDAEAKRARRSAETSEESAARKAKDAAKHRAKISTETAEESFARKTKAAGLERSRISAQSEEETVIRKARRSAADALRLTAETPDESFARKASKAESMRNLRINRANPRIQKARELAINAERHENEIELHSCGKMDIKCDHCHALHFIGEQAGRNTKVFEECCDNGKVTLPPLEAFPELLKSLMTHQSQDSEHFMESIRSYNSSFAFASMGATMATPPSHGPYCFRIHGQIYHRAGAIHPEADKKEPPVYAQLYVLDPASAVDHRMKHPANKGCKLDLMHRIDSLMRQNPFAKAVKMLHEVEKEAIADAKQRGVECPEIKMAIKQDRGRLPNAHPGRYNAPTVNEVAMVFQDDDGAPPDERDLIIHCRYDPTKPNSRKFQRLGVLEPNLEPMTYPLLFPTAQQGWGDKRYAKPNAKWATAAQYYGHRLSIRPNEFNQLLNAGRLTLQYMVDGAVRIQNNNLNWIRMNQKKIRSESYGELAKQVHKEPNENNTNVGVRVILPSTFQESLRYLLQKYQDAMTIIVKYGKPDLFLTMTCNPNWIEIRESIEKWQQPAERPDVIARVFNIKLKSLLKDIDELQIFGKVAAKLHVIEFQKRGLPHAHILITLDKDSKLRTDEDIDKYVSAEIPDPEKSPRLYNIVTKHMVHGPCGNDKPDCICMKDGKCMKGFPKPFQEETNGNIDGYARYKRRKTEPVKVGNKFIDNSWIVPYNAYLSLKYDCHINVEVCASIKSVKYLYKYVYKGHDCANVKITENNDEIANFIDTRYISAPEAMWKIFRMPMHGMSHHVERLDVHLPDEQSICFEQEDLDCRPDQVLKRAERLSTKLQAWFALNEKDANARQYLYREIPEHYTWKEKEREWRPRQRRFDTIGRLHNASLKDAERYYLRLLLLHIRGATSFEDLKTVNGTYYMSFREAAKARNLLIDDDVWRNTLLEAVVFKMPMQIREVFAYVLCFGTLSNPLGLWEEFKKEMIEDFCYKLHEKGAECRNCDLHALKDIRSISYQHVNANTWISFGLPHIPQNLPDLNLNSYDEWNEFQEGERMRQTLNPEQLLAFNSIMSAISDPILKQKCYFLDGPGGSGKTYLYKTLLHVLRGQGKLVYPSASTGIAANLLSGGRTYHSLFQLPVPITDTSVSRIKAQSKDAENMRNAQLIIIDECTMASRYSLNCIDRTLKDIMDNTIPFGGKTLLLGGDFRQCLSIVQHACRAQIVSCSLKRSPNWKSFKTLTLVNNMRSKDPKYSEWLLKLGEGKLETFKEFGDDVIEIPEEFICKGSIVTEIFGENLLKEDVPKMAKRAILCPKNTDVDKINNEIMDLIPGEYTTYLSNDSLESDAQTDWDNYPVEFLNSLNPTGLPHHELKLKVGVIVMLLRNLNTKRGLCNGTRLIVEKLCTNVIKAKVLTGSAEGQTVMIPRIDLSPSDSNLPLKFKRRQFPIRPAFAMTINKSQGQTLEKVGIYLPEPCFGHGQLYVAFSRAELGCNVKVKVLKTLQQGELIPGSSRVFTRNVVYTEILKKD